MLAHCSKYRGQLILSGECQKKTIKADKENLYIFVSFEILKIPLDLMASLGVRGSPPPSLGYCHNITFFICITSCSCPPACAIHSNKMTQAYYNKNAKPSISAGLA